jgi:hypothetical protein
MHLQALLVASALAGAGSALPSPAAAAAAESVVTRQTPARQPCGQVADLQTRGARTVLPSIALACLNSVALDVRRDTTLVD